MRKWLKIFFLFCIFGLLIFSNSLNNKFLLDDYVFLNNPVLSGSKYILSQWDPYREQALGVVDSNESTVYYRPMAHMVLDFCYDTFKYNYRQYHLLNLFLFVFAASLIYSLIGKISNNYDLAFMVSFFYLIHPVNGIIVNYISASVFAFQMIFMLGTILLLWESLERNNNRVLYALSLLFSFLSLFWNESGILTPFYLSAVILLCGKDPLRKKITLLFPYFLIVFSYLIFRSLFLDIDKEMLKQLTLFHSPGLLYLYMGALFKVVMWYITQLFYPQGIVMIWATSIVHQNVFWNCLGLCMVISMYMFLFIRFAKNKMIQLALIWILIGFAFVCLASFRSPGLGACIEPHWFIFSSIGFFILVAYFCLMVLGRTKMGGGILFFCLIFVWGNFSYANNKLWFDQITYCCYWSQHVPNPSFLYVDIAEGYLDAGDLKESRKYLVSALSGHPFDVGLYDHLGAVDTLEKDWKGAESNYEKVLKIDPSSADVYNNLGYVYLQELQWAKAKEYFSRSLILNPLLVKARLNLAKIYLKDHEYRKAVDLCFQNLDVRKDDLNTLLTLIYISEKEKDPVSIKNYAYRIIHHEDDPQVLTELGIKMGIDGFPVIAIDSYAKAMRVAPDYEDVYLNAGKLFGNLGKYDEAIHLWKIGSSIDPSDQRFKIDIEKAEKLKSGLSTK